MANALKTSNGVVNAPPRLFQVLREARAQAAERLKEIRPAAPAMAEAKGYIVRVHEVSLDQVKAEFFQGPLLITNCVAAHDAWREQKDCRFYIANWASRSALLVL